jgi:hypothetical protein
VAPPSVNDGLARVLTCMIAKGSIVQIMLAGDNKLLLKTRQLQRHATACADYFLCVDWCNRSIFIQSNKLLPRSSETSNKSLWNSFIAAALARGGGKPNNPKKSPTLGTPASICSSFSTDHLFLPMWHRCCLLQQFHSAGFCGGVW